MLDVVQPVVAVIMGSQSDWPVMKGACDVLDEFGVRHEAEVVSAHRTPDRLFAFAKGAQIKGFKVIIAGAGGAAHLPGMAASMTDLPVLGVPVPSASNAINDHAAMLSILQMPAGIAVATFAVGSRDAKNAGARNAGLMAVQILALADPELAAHLNVWRKALTDSVPESVS